LRRVFNRSYLHLIYLQIRTDAPMARTEREVAGLLREQHRLASTRRPDDFFIMNQTTILTAARQARDSFTLLIAGLALLSLLVGGTGIAAVMWLSVRERTGEIGLRMAVGSRPRDILVQFLCESLMLGLTGGLGGVVLGTGASWLIGLPGRWQTAITPLPVVLVPIVSLLIGLVSGIFPARQAARIDPIMALRDK